MLLWLHFVRTGASSFQADLGRLTYATVSPFLRTFKRSKGPSLLRLPAMNICFSNARFVTKKGADFLTGNLNLTKFNSKILIHSNRDGMSPYRCVNHVSASLSKCKASRKTSLEPSLYRSGSQEGICPC